MLPDNQDRIFCLIAKCCIWTDLNDYVCWPHVKEAWIWQCHIKRNWANRKKLNMCHYNSFIKRRQMLEQQIWEIFHLDIFSKRSQNRDVNWLALLHNRVKNLPFLQTWEIIQNINITIHLLTLHPRKYQEELSDVNREFGLVKINIYLSGQSIYWYSSQWEVSMCVSSLWTKFQHRNVIILNLVCFPENTTLPSILYGLYKV